MNLNFYNLKDGKEIKMSFNVLELHWFHKNYDLIQKLNLREDLNKVFGDEKTNILFQIINHPQTLEILKKHDIQAPQVEPGNFLGQIACNKLLNKIRSKLTSIVSFDKIIESSNEVDSFDSLWFLPDIISRKEFSFGISGSEDLESSESSDSNSNIHKIIKINIFNGCLSFYVKFIVFMLRKPDNKLNPKIYDFFKEKYIEVGRSAASSEAIEIWSRI